MDWIGQNVYWTDAGHKWIGMASYRKDRIGMHKIIINDTLVTPTGIVTDPTRGYDNLCAVPLQILLLPPLVTLQL